MVDVDTTDSTNDSVTYNIEVTAGGAELAENQIIKVKLDIGKNLQNVTVTHNGSEVFAAVAGEAELVDGTYCYDAATGILIICSDSFSPYEIGFEPADYDACVGAQGYYTLQEAVDAAKEGDTVKLLDNMELSAMVTVAADKKITLDLNGKAITVAAGTFAIENHGTLTIEDSVGTGTVTARIGVDNYGTLVLNSGTVIANEQGGAAVYNNADCNAKFTMNGGTLQATFVGTSNDNSGGACLRNMAGAVTTITGGTLKSVSARTYAIISNGALEISPAEGKEVSMTAYRGIAIDNGTAVFNGGTFTVLDANAEEGKYVAYEIYYALYVGGNTSEVTVNGGTFTSPESAVWRPVWDDEGEVLPATNLYITGGTFNGSLIGNAAWYPSQNIVVSGGTFSTDPSAFVAEGYEATEIEGGWTVQEAPTA